MASRLAAYRYQTLFTKEPEMAQWISGFDPGGVFVDVGANVGGYTVWAAMHRDMRVFAFEPEAQNFAVLNKNLQLNDLGGRVRAFPAALSDGFRLSVLNLGDTRIGGSRNSFGDAVDENLESRPALFEQGSISVSLDGVVADGVLPVPNHIKIDVDGFEHKVIDGATTVLGHADVTSVMVELNMALAPHREIMETMRALGFTLPPQKSQRLQEKNAGNCLFRRPGT